MPKIFISYRREDAGGFAGRLADALSARYGPGNVFRDVDDIVAGSEFVAALEQALATSDVFIPLIGRAWLSSGPGSRPRLHEPDDYVRREIARALVRGIRIIPALLDGARMPAAQDLPAELEPLIYRQAITLDDASWNPDVDRLAHAIDAASQAPGSSAPDPAAPGRRRRIALLAGMAAIAFAGYGAWRFTRPLDVSGEWRFDDGSRWVIRQDGRQLHIEDVHHATREVWRAGTGRIANRTVEVDLQYRFERGVSLHGPMELSGDGRNLDGLLTEAPSGRRLALTLRR